MLRNVRVFLIASCVACLAASAAAQTAQSQTAQEPYKPTVGMAGKDVVWVPNPENMVEKMLDLAKVTPQDVVIDLGSGDGRNVIAAAKRGAKAIGVEYNADLVEFSKRAAAEAGVAEKATFLQGDMYEADISSASVMALFLLPENLGKLTAKFLDLKPGSRIVANTFAIPGWTPDVTERTEGDCTTWCTTMLWIVPAKVEGKWRFQQAELALKQEFQMVTGTLTAQGKVTPIEDGKMRGDEISFTVNGVQYSGRVVGNTIEGTNTTANNNGWKATKATQ